MKRTILLTLLTLFAAANSFANIANPDLPNSKKSIDTTLMIKLDRDAKEARLIIPRNQIKKLRAELESLDTGGDNTAAAISTGSGFSPTQSVMSGMFISLGVLFGGLLFVRSKRTPNVSGHVAACVAVLFAIGGLVVMTFANAGPPPEARTITGKMFSQSMHLYGFGSGKIRLEVSEDQQYPTLIVPDPKPDSSNPSEE
jgi:hypothetical protein